MGALTVSHTVTEFSGVLVAIGKFTDTLTVVSTVTEFPDIAVAIGIDYGTQTMKFTITELADILVTVRTLVVALTVKFTIPERSDLLVAIEHCNCNLTFFGARICQATQGQGIVIFLFVEDFRYTVYFLYYDLY